MAKKNGSVDVNDGRVRCKWAATDPMLAAYHDLEWGQPIRTDAGHLERMALEVFQCGLSWKIVLVKRDAFRRAFVGFEPRRVAALTGRDAARLCRDASIIRNRMKIESTIGKFGQIDILVNTAGGFRGGKPVHETPVETWDFLMDLNARTVFLMSRAAIPHMLPRRSGKIVNVAARAAMKGESGSGAYIASKMAVIRLPEALAEELKGEGINVNCILPGTLDTPEYRSVAPDADFSKWVAPESMAGVILFLLSGLARDIHGAAVPVYGRS